MTTIIGVPARLYPNLPPSLPGESAEDYAARLLRPDTYPQSRSRACAYGHHEVCADRAATTCGCPHHHERHQWARHTRPGDPLRMEWVIVGQRPSGDWFVEFWLPCTQPEGRITVFPWPDTLPDEAAALAVAREIKSYADDWEEHAW